MVNGGGVRAEESLCGTCFCQNGGGAPSGYEPCGRHPRHHHHPKAHPNTCEDPPPLRGKAPSHPRAVHKPSGTWRLVECGNEVGDASMLEALAFRYRT